MPVIIDRLNDLTYNVGVSNHSHFMGFYLEGEMETTSCLSCTQKRIIEAAIKVFSEKGFEGATTSEIAQEAGVAEGTIFRHFGTKKGILQGILLRAVDNFRKPEIVVSLAGMIGKKGGEKDPQFRMHLIKDQLNSIRRYLPMLKLLFYEAQFHPEVRETMFKKIARPVIDLLSEPIKQRQLSGDFRNLNTDLMALSLLASLWGYLVWKETAPEREDRSGDRELAQVLDIWLKGVEANSCSC